MILSLLPRRPFCRTPARFVGLLAALLAALAAAACAPATEAPEPAAEAEPEVADSLAAMDAAAREYVALVLELGTHDEGYVDAYYGPAEWRQEAEAAPRAVAEIGRRARVLAGEMEDLVVPGAGQRPEEDLEAPTAAPPTESELTELRRAFLARQLAAVAARAQMLGGETMSFDEEAAALYDARPPSFSEEHFAATIDEIDALLPGEGPVIDRYRRWRDRFVIPPARLDAVFAAAVEECRRRTAEHLELPAGEGFRVEYVRDKPWSGYNWYQGGFQSLIQVNESLPIHIDRAVDLACHEGYPGHHVFNALFEKHLVRDRGWHEYSVYPLYSPQSLLAEGTANFGIRVAFPGDERVAFEREVLFPLAGLDPETADDYYAIAERLEELSYAGNEAARRYLDGEIDAAEAAAWMERYALMPPERAKQRVEFMDAYRSYVINYNLGQDMVRQWVEANGGGAGDPERRWQVFSLLLTTPRTPSGIRVEEDVEGGH
jgi:hypothetical protein